MGIQSKFKALLIFSVTSFNVIIFLMSKNVIVLNLTSHSTKYLNHSASNKISKLNALIEIDKGKLQNNKKAENIKKMNHQQIVRRKDKKVSHYSS